MRAGSPNRCFTQGLTLRLDAVTSMQSSQSLPNASQPASNRSAFLASGSDSRSDGARTHCSPALRAPSAGSTSPASTSPASTSPASSHASPPAADFELSRDPDAVRLRSYDRIVQAAVNRDSFSVAEVREAVGLEGRLVNQVLRLLSNDGLIVRLDACPTDIGAAHDIGAAQNLPGRSRSSRSRRQRSPAFRWTEKRNQLTPAEWARSKVYSNRITRAPVADRPRERLLQQGATSLRTADLIAILIRSGNARESAIQSGERIAAAYANQLENLTDARRGDLREISSAIGETAFCQIMAGIELGRRVAEAKSQVEPRPRIQSTDDAREYCRTQFRRLAIDAKHEEFHIVLLNTRYEPIGSHRVSSGTLDASLVHPREVFRPAIKEAAKAILLVHNHPSGDPTPGEQDIRVTRRLNEVAKLVGIDVLDHLVVAAQGTYSLRDAGLGFD